MWHMAAQLEATWRRGIWMAAVKGDGEAEHRTDILTSFTVDQLQNERSTGNDA